MPLNTYLFACGFGFNGKKPPLFADRLYFSLFFSYFSANIKYLGRGPVFSVLFSGGRRFMELLSDSPKITSCISLKNI